MTSAMPQVKGQPISTSVFYMWRCVICIAWADGVIQKEERAYFDKIFANIERVYGLTPEQKQAFNNDLSAPGAKLGDLLRYINDPACRSQLLYFGGILARVDGIVDPREEHILKKLHADQLASLDMEQIRSEARAAVADETFRHELSIQELRPKRFWTGALDRLLLWMGIDIIG